MAVTVGPVLPGASLMKGFASRIFLTVKQVSRFRVEAACYI
jgi:hypothetical protein